MLVVFFGDMMYAHWCFVNTTYMNIDLQGRALRQSGSLFSQAAASCSVAKQRATDPTMTALECGGFFPDPILLTNRQTAMTSLPHWQRYNRHSNYCAT